MVNRKFFLLLGIIFALVLVVAGYFRIINKGKLVNFQLLSGYGNLSRDGVNWLKLKEPNNGIYAYSLDDANPYELMIFYNKTARKIEYNTLGLKARLFNETLRINITDELAVDDSQVENRLVAYFQIKQKPRNIEVYLNNQPTKSVVDKGTSKSLIK